MKFRHRLIETLTDKSNCHLEILHFETQCKKMRPGDFIVADLSHENRDIVT